MHDCMLQSLPQRPQRPAFPRKKVKQQKRLPPQNRPPSVNRGGRVGSSHRAYVPHRFTVPSTHVKNGAGKDAKTGPELEPLVLPNSEEDRITARSRPIWLKRVHLQRVGSCHAGCADRPIFVGMRRGLLGSLLGCMVGGLTAAHLQGELGARGPHLQRDDAPLLYPRLRAISARLGMAPAWHPAGHPLEAGDGHFAGLGRRPACRPRELGGPVARALGPHTRPPQAGRDAILAGRRPPGFAENIRGLALHTCWRSGALAGGRRFAGAFRHHRRGAILQCCSSKKRATRR